MTSAMDNNKSKNSNNNNNNNNVNNNNNNNNNNNKNNNNSNNNNKNGKHKDTWDTNKMTNIDQQRKCRRHSSYGQRSESVISTDSDIRFTRRKLGDSQKCGCAVIAGFLVFLLLSGVAVYIGYTYLRPNPLPERVFRAKLRIIQGDSWTPDLADQNSSKFQNKCRDYRERIDLVVTRSDLKESYEGSEVLALDGTERENDLIIHFNLHFDPYNGLVSAADLYAIFLEEINSKNSRFFKNITIDATNFEIKELLGQLDDIPIVTASSPLGGKDDKLIDDKINENIPIRRCEPVRLPYCQSIGYNITTYPNLLGHNSIDEVIADVISFRELVDAECFRQAYDFVCRLLQPPCYLRKPLEPMVGQICRDYCQSFWNGCGNRLPIKFKKYFDCEQFPESTGTQSCHSKPNCVNELESNALSGRLCDGIADCPDLSDELTCSYCPPDSLYCGRGRACVSKTLRCDGKLDCPDGADEKDCLSIAPLVSVLNDPEQITPHRQQFYTEGFAVFSEKGNIGKLCAEGLDSPNDIVIRKTVADSLCKALGFEQLSFSEIRNDTEPNQNYVRVLNPRSQEISFVRTMCNKKQAIYVSCRNLECGVQSMGTAKHITSLPKMAGPGDWPWFVALFRDETHVCDGTLISDEWVLTTESCFQGQPKATWIAVFGLIRLNSHAPWIQRRRIIGMVKSPVEGSTAALIRLETPVIYSDFIRPICLSDHLTMNSLIDKTKEFIPYPEKLHSDGIKSVERSSSSSSSSSFTEYKEYFNAPNEVSLQQRNNPISSARVSGGSGVEYSKEYIAKFTDESENSPRAEPYRQFENYPLPENVPQTKQYEHLIELNDTLTFNNKTKYSLNNLNLQQQQLQQEWINCNTLGWNLQRDQLQRIQLKIGNMASCENISIATVNSMCTEATYHKQDCTEEENAGSPVICLLRDSNRWALVGMASWRIACSKNGIERPRMYDKITSNSAWIRDTINST